MARRARLLTLALILLAFAVTACGAGETPPPPGVRPDGFPTGVFAKTFDDPDFGPIRLYWVFDADGNWAEVPEAAEGQTIRIWPGSGRYTVDGDLVSISVDAPPGMSEHTHRWRLEGDRLVTSFDHSADPADVDWFAMLDGQPWVRVP